MTEAKHRGAEDERSSAVWVDSGPLCPRGAGGATSRLGIRWPAIRQRTCGPVRTRNHGRHARSRAGSRRVQSRLGSVGINARREPNHASGLRWNAVGHPVLRIQRPPAGSTGPGATDATAVTPVRANSRWRHVAAANILPMPGAWDTADELHVVAPARRCPGRRSPLWLLPRARRAGCLGYRRPPRLGVPPGRLNNKRSNAPILSSPCSLLSSMLSSRSASQPRRGSRAAPPSGPAAAR